MHLYAQPAIISKTSSSAKLKKRISCNFEHFNFRQLIVLAKFLTAEKAVLKIKKKRELKENIEITNMERIE